jgi:hypothetical protein
MRIVITTAANLPAQLGLRSAVQKAATIEKAFVGAAISQTIWKCSNHDVILASAVPPNGRVIPLACLHPPSAVAEWRKRLSDACSVKLSVGIFLQYSGRTAYVSLEWRG